MATEHDFAADVRAELADAGDIREVKMFGGIGFMLNGNMVAAASRRGLLLRVGKDRQGQALARPGARPMLMRGRRLDGYVYVDPPELNRQAIRSWLKLAVACVQAMPPKTGRKPTGRKGEKK